MRKTKRREERREKKKKRWSSREAGPCTRHPSGSPYFSPRIFARPPRSILRVPGERPRRDGTRCAFRIAKPSPHRRTARRHRSASCTYLPGTCTTLFTTRSYTPSLPHGAIVLKIKKCVSGSEGKKLPELGSRRGVVRPRRTLLSFLPSPFSRPFSFFLSLVLCLYNFSLFPHPLLSARASDRRSQPAPA